MAHYITTHDANGNAIFFNPKAAASTASDSQQQHSIPIPIGDIRIISSSHQSPPSLSNESDVEQYYQQDRISPFFPGERRICPENGTATCIISMAPGAGGGGMHRTMTLDTVVVIEGEVEITLDSGEMRTLKTGDSLVQRGTMHKWRNVTPNEGWARWVAFIQAAAGPLRVGDRVLGNEWIH